MQVSTKAHYCGLPVPGQWGGATVGAPPSLPGFANRGYRVLYSATPVLLFVIKLSSPPSFWLAICTKKQCYLVLYNSTFLVDYCVEFCEKYLRKGLYCINKFFVCCELWSLFLLQQTSSGPSFFFSYTLSSSLKARIWNEQFSLTEKAE